MQVKIGNNVYGWGGDARDLANDPHAYGPKLLTQAEAVQLAKAITDTGWEPFSKRVLEERQVFLIQPKAWRRAVQLPSLPGHILQVRARAKAPEPPKPIGDLEVHGGPPTEAPAPPPTVGPDLRPVDSEADIPPEGTPPVEKPTPELAKAPPEADEEPEEHGDPNAGKGDETPEPGVPAGASSSSGPSDVEKEAADDAEDAATATEPEGA